MLDWEKNFPVGEDSRGHGRKVWTGGRLGKVVQRAETLRHRRVRCWRGQLLGTVIKDNQEQDCKTVVATISPKD